MTTRYELMTLKPDQYLANGFRDARGLPWPELTGLWALASAEQLRMSGVTAAAFDPLVAETLHPETSRLKTPEAGVRLIRDCSRRVGSEADRGPFREHLAAILRLLALSEASASLRAASPRPTS